MKDDKKTKSEQIAENYKTLMTHMSELDIVNQLFAGLENTTGLSSTQPQREYINAQLQENIMKWAEVMQHMQTAMSDPKAMAEYKKKVNQGK